ncbi:hypothetical protein L1994_00520 [Methanomicrobium antiquum]|uniref:Uncharacterized protein n=1 Tax=Methanomicrobium antiquum TaxID=487686 RepID=A0AAF0FNW2_9EURY|nr:hypothetical protein [Methanomicrobium antiquum]WFN36915.1 hypothetical protein L1994_00520 [Methanomicrobium antiquum]
MKTRILDINWNGLTIGTTPLLVPSFSSQAGTIDSKKPEELQNSINNSLSYISDGLLISAYDLHSFYDHHSSDGLEIDFSNLDFVIIDSGGYECLSENDSTDNGTQKNLPNEWNDILFTHTVEKFLKNIELIKSKIPVILVSFDHPSIPNEEKTFLKQIYNAKNSFKGKNVVKNFLIKSENNDIIEIDKLLTYSDEFQYFDILGFTEKELGTSTLQRMCNIAKIRECLDKKELKIPIHIFGSLDPVTTPLYYMAGADIFDGLSWLRYFYYQNYSGYNHSLGRLKWGIEYPDNNLIYESRKENYAYLKNLELVLRRLHKTQSFESFNELNMDPKFFEESCKLFKSKITR